MGLTGLLGCNDCNGRSRRAHPGLSLFPGVFLYGLVFQNVMNDVEGWDMPTFSPKAFYLFIILLYHFLRDS
ncbi:uncharacterized protein GGS22DRAFT_155945 [Annulohypoxylon maeteangense]|uniref:uncharacterized protein n=1 Tax=Annulohypoxylon maeteangense TaxID=1927788 RepID=UPI002007B174|nr:uncharacterized protein GGS22DRAFT_155945 [Annulohypoxylon maeteangense]KAI0888463.1 hypothetical protein GGS22DRAFT_155945 [Annulohypoxylon maeteangense]